ncbi:MAG: hypothetical protein Q8P20_09460 [bacterium]|nr:hypothetical protein [bacterium]
MTWRADQLSLLLKENLTSAQNSKHIEFLRRAEPIFIDEKFVDRLGKSAKDRIKSEIEWKQMSKLSKRNKTSMSRKKIIKDINDNRDKYSGYRKNLSELEAQKAKLEHMIEEAKTGLHGHRKRMLMMNDILQTFDLADCNYAVMYGPERSDVSYVMGKGKDAQEFHIEIGNDGELCITSWPEYLRERRSESRRSNEAAHEAPIAEDLFLKYLEDEDEPEELEEELEDELEDELEEENATEDVAYAASDIIPGIESLEDSSPRTNEQPTSSWPTQRFVRAE